MERKGKIESCCTPTSASLNCCKVESLVSIDERGQMVLPKELRDKADLHAGDKLAAISWEKEGKVQYIILIKAQDFADIVKEMLGPMIKEITKQETSNPKESRL